MKAKELLGTLSPVYGMATGKGMFGNAVGLLPALAKDYRDDKEDKKEARAAAAMTAKPQMPAMKKGGKVKAKVSSASKRADGCAVKGKTRGKFV
jgi:hypothetical protein